MISNTLRAGVGFYNRLSSIQLTFVQKAAFFLISTALLLVITATLLPYIDDIGVWGYVAAFVVTGLSSATVVMPSPGFAAVLLMAKDLNWLLLGISAGIGGALGEMTAYYIGTHGTETLEGHKSYEWFQRGMKKAGRPYHSRVGARAPDPGRCRRPHSWRRSLPGHQVSGLPRHRQGCDDRDAYVSVS